MTDDLASFRRAFDRLLIGGLWLHVILIAFIAWHFDEAWLLLAATAAVLAASVTLLCITMVNAPTTRPAVGIAAIGMVSLLLASARGSAWQVDIHMYYFAVLAVLAAYCDWTVIAAAAVAICLHHLLLNVVAPAFVFPGGTDYGRVVLHGAVVLVQALALVWMSRRVTRLFATVGSSLAAAEKARDEARAARAEQIRLEAEANESRRSAMEHAASQLETELRGAVSSINAAAHAAREQASGMASDAERAAERTKLLSEEAILANDEVQAGVAAVTWMSAAGQETAHRLAATAVQTGTNADAQTQSVRNIMQTLSAKADRIGDVVSLIDNVATQTNLLALNATIEAARAGATGKGFAVVANEVKALASQTAGATRQVRDQINALQADTAAAVAAIAAIAGTIGEMSDAGATVAASAEAQHGTAGEIARYLECASDRFVGMSKGLADVTAVTGDTFLTARSVVQGVAQMEESAAGLRDATESMIARLRAS